MQTNPHKFHVDAVININHYSESFTYKSDAFKWLSALTNGKVNTEEKLKAFNKEAEDSLSGDYITIHEEPSV